MRTTSSLLVSIVALDVCYSSNGTAIYCSIAKVRSLVVAGNLVRDIARFHLGECSDADDLSNVTSCPNMIAPDAALYTLHRSEYDYDYARC